MRKFALFIALTCALVLAARIGQASCSGVCQGWKFSSPPAGANDLHVEFDEVIGSVAHIPTPPAPVGDVSWPSVSVSGTGVTFSGTSMPRDGTTSYKFTFPQGATPAITDAYWTHDGSQIIGAVEKEQVPYE